VSSKSQDIHTVKTFLRNITFYKIVVTNPPEAHNISDTTKNP